MEFAAQFAAVGGVLLLLLAATWLLRRGGPSGFRLGKRGTAIEVVESRTVSPQLSIAIIRAQGREWTLAVHSGGVRILHRGDATGSSS